MQLFLPKSGGPFAEGIRLASWNSLYIVASAAVFAIAFGVVLSASFFFRSLSVGALVLLLPLLGIIAAGYLYLWVRFSAAYARNAGPAQALIVNLIGILPNLGGYFLLNALIANNEACGIPMVAALGWLAFWLPVFVMPVLGLASWVWTRRHTA